MTLACCARLSYLCNDDDDSSLSVDSTDSAANEEEACNRVDCNRKVVLEECTEAVSRNDDDDDDDDESQRVPSK